MSTHEITDILKWHPNFLLSTFMEYTGASFSDSCHPYRRSTELSTIGVRNDVCQNTYVCIIENKNTCKYAVCNKRLPFYEVLGSNAHWYTSIFHGPLSRYTIGGWTWAGMPERFSRHQLETKPLVSDPGMHHGTRVTHVPWCMSGSLTHFGGENVPGIPGAWATRDFTYRARAHAVEISPLAAWSSCYTIFRLLFQTLGTGMSNF